jgi:hypothetical protein
MTANDAINNFTYIHPAYAAIFNDVLRETDHPALALHSHFTALHLATCYGIIDLFDVLAPATTISLLQVLHPDTLSYSLVVTAIIVAHLLTMAYESLRFVYAGARACWGTHGLVSRRCTRQKRCHGWQKERCRLTMR